MPVRYESDRKLLSNLMTVVSYMRIRIARLDNKLLAKAEATLGIDDERRLEQLALEDLESLARNPPVASEATYLCAHRLWNSRDLQARDTAVDIIPLAKYMLSMALEMGNLKAALDLAHVANLKPDGVIPPGALREIQKAALDRSDSRGMAVYTRYLLNLRRQATRDTRVLAFDLAQELSSFSEPRDPSRAIRLTSTAFHKWEAPWSLLRDAALQRLELDSLSRSMHQQINETLVSTLQKGVDDYNDPEACRVLSNHPSLEEFSSEWISLKTKSAMDGDLESCYLLGRYYIEYWGWYPCTGKKPSEKPEALSGFDWLELSAEGYVEKAQVMSERYLMIALLLRENSMRAEGHEVVKRGIESIYKYSTDRSAKTGIIKKLQEFDRSWDHDFSARASRFLGEPVLSPENRHGAFPLGGLKSPNLRPETPWWVRKILKWLG